MPPNDILELKNGLVIGRGSGHVGGHVSMKGQHREIFVVME